MKQLVVLTFLATFLFFGCSDTTNTGLDPANPSTNYSKFKMPPAKDLSTEVVITESKRIIGSVGGIMNIQGSYWATTGLVTIDAALDIPGGSFYGDEVLTITKDGEFVDVDLSPSIGFVTPVYLDVTMTGLDLSNTDPNDVDFVYFAEDGSIEQVSYQSLNVDLQNGTLEVDNAQITHFSRYGFVK